MEAVRKDNRLRCKCRKIVIKHILYQKQEGRKRRKTNKGLQPPPQLTKKVVHHHQQKDPAWSHAVRDPLRQFFKDLQQLNGKELKEAIKKGLLVTLQFKVTQSTRQKYFDTTILSFSAIVYFVCSRGQSRSRRYSYAFSTSCTCIRYVAYRYGT